MNLTKNDFKGTGKVLRFTLQTHLKNKSTIVSTIIFFLIALISVPIFTILSGGKSVASDICAVTRVYINDESGFDLDLSEMRADAYLANTVIEKISSDENIDLSDTEVFVHISVSEEGELFFDTYTARTEADIDNDVNYILSSLTYAVENARLYSVGATPAQIALASASYSGSVTTEKNFRRSSQIAFGTKFAVQYVYSILVMLLSNMAASYIARTVVEEKASKLVELLMVSVRPLALMLGKILAMIIYIFGMFICTICMFAVSYFITGMFIDVSAIGSAMSAFGLNVSALNISPATIIIVLVSLILGYFTFSIISGINGACCTVMEDLEYAHLSTVLIIIGGYIVSCIAPAFSSQIAAIIFSLFPVVSIFCAPALYVIGSISLHMLCLSWVLQAVVVAALAVFCARVYNDLLIHRGSRIKFSGLLAIARSNGKEEA